MGVIGYRDHGGYSGKMGGAIGVLFVNNRRDKKGLGFFCPRVSIGLGLQGLTSVIEFIKVAAGLHNVLGILDGILITWVL